METMGAVGYPAARERDRALAVLRDWALAVGGAGAGAVTALVGTAFLLAAGVAAVPAAPALAWRPARAALGRALGACSRPLVAIERRRLARLFGTEIAVRPGTARSVGYLAARAPVGLFGGLVLLVFPAGAYLAVSPLEVLDGNSEGIVPAGLVLMYLSVQGTVGLVGTERWLARRLLGPSRQDLMERRIGELTASRAAVVAAVDGERRRIERDLHDGVQQRLVVLGMALGRARRDPGSAKGRELIAQAHEEARGALGDLREVAWRVYPTALAEAGLHAALSGLAERAAVPVALDYTLDRGPGSAVETGAYFVVAEAVTNAVKHSGADSITVAVGTADRGGGGAPARRVVRVRVADNGRGGADPAGTGLAGLAGRAAALDGCLRVDSPPGGPTEITAEFPCA
uniref:histidine kinase n=1 Tax=Nocardiopsis sp. CMB-M0232 TaxID=1231934 RepID=A0A0D5BUL9_9ACTN|nr:ATPase [Nocardiopsis sp. CMB-M0232]